MISNPISPDARLRRKQVAEALTAMGFPVAPASLATMASRGNGPPYQTWGRVVLYRWGTAVEWAEARMTAPRRSTSEMDASEKARASKRSRAMAASAPEE
jgi:hypothetical protein